MIKEKVHKIIILTLAIALIMLLSNCTKEVNLKIFQEKTEIGIKSLFTADSLIKIRVEQSVNTGDEFLPAISNATIFLKEDDLNFDTLKKEIDGYYNSNKPASEGKSYSAEIYVPGYTKLTAFNNVPRKVNILNATNTDSIGLDEDGSLVSEARITFADNPLKRDFYEIEVKKHYLNEFNETIGTVRGYYRELGKEPVLTNEGLLPYYPETLIFSDSMFNGQTIDLTINYIFSDFIGEYYGVKTFITLRHISEEYYTYVRSLILYSNSVENSIWGGSEPINVYSNVVNGFGIFAAYNSDTITCREIK